MTAVAETNQQLIPVGPKLIIGPRGCTLQKGQVFTYDEAEHAVATLREIRNRLDFVEGDVRNLVRELFKEEASQLLDDHETFTPESRKTAIVNEWVTKRVAPELREMAPSFSHCQTVAALSPAKQKQFIEKAVEEGWSVAKLRTEVLATDEGGKGKLRWLLIVDCGTEANQTKLADRLEKDGYGVTAKTGRKSTRKAPKRDKTVTAKKRRASKPNQRRKK